MVYCIRLLLFLEIFEFVIVVVRYNFLECIFIYYVIVREGVFLVNNLYYLKFMRDGLIKNLILVCYFIDGWLFMGDSKFWWY